MAKKNKAQEKEVKGGDSPQPSSASDQVIIVHFRNGQPRLTTNGKLQVWHFMVATALLQQVTLQDVLRGTLRQSSAVDAAIKQGPSGLVLPS